MGSRHISVMVEEVMAFLRCEPGHTYVDATLGGGGHAFEILKRSAPDGMLIGMEWDEEALSEAKKTLLSFGDRVKLIRENFVHLPDLMKAESADGILLDLGLSSIQLEREERGFSFKGEGPLDMRMDQRIDETAADLVNNLSSEELESILFQYGEERWAKRIVRALVEEREREPIRTTQALRKIVHHAIPRRFHSRRIDPATRTFQALRIRVNEELENLQKILETGWKILKKGGRMCVISFHSLEDRMVKETFRALEKQEKMVILTKKPVTPSEEEQKRNPRSRSAKLRCAERI
ncbi:MAG TPA: 16S rRNA (cytosine(1402)-N(4))-methyltransferase RsmH [Thermodesulfobacteriota bacterium]|nr:16S rRNA (cytosine(1402)-N(4))-methyltransferase RsmH [Thermodesulfobacteriota bacterium]